ncbi:hypothetical protein ACUXZZ_20470 [Streptomyces graminifolii]|uniref:hypothetical protein n=1 Tax=Streptomyces graminifolii TaxID=1266771 RepID=UPI0040589755
MPNPLRLGRTLALITLALAGLSAYTAWQHQWISFVLLADVTGTVALITLLERRVQRRARAEAARAERMARPYHPEPPPLVPCCWLWVHSHGGVHDGNRCTRPLAARTRLNQAEKDAFTAITSNYTEGEN